ncbi:MAG: hypothetical protein KDE58_36235 [Caldilineaceae bacterium]|nr:hypothetical protein [Caldilineaceae bacterium]
MKKSMLGLIILLTSLFVTGCVKVQGRFLDPPISTVESEPTATATLMPTSTKTATPNWTATAAVEQARIAESVKGTLTALASATPTTGQLTSTPSATNTVVSTPTKTRTPEPTPTATNMATRAPTSTQRPTMTSTWTPTPRPTATPVPTVQMRIRIVSSSHWTTVQLPPTNLIIRQRSIGLIGDMDITSIQGKEIHLNPKDDLVESGHTYELVQDLVLRAQKDQEELEFDVQLGCNGETTLEVYNTLTATPTLVGRFLAGPAACDAPESFTVSTSALMTTQPPSPQWRQIQMRISTTSDWVSVFLPPEIKLAKRNEVAREGSITAENIQGRFSQIVQPLTEAEAGKEISITLAFFILNGTEIQELPFTIEMGCIGETTVEVFPIGLYTLYSAGKITTNNCNLPGKTFAINLDPS